MKMLVNGKWIDSISKEVIEVFNPSTHEKIEEVPRGKAEDINMAVEYAKEG
jgi:acyl-CoA reductase-like NAD-dependent aldehyde dehydrogenase